jgi:hypothetical protein
VVVVVLYSDNQVTVVQVVQTAIQGAVVIPPMAEMVQDIQVLVVHLEVAEVEVIVVQVMVVVAQYVLYGVQLL